MDSEYRFTSGEFKVTKQMQDDFDKNGFIILRGFLDLQEVGMAKKCFEDTDQVLSNQMKVGDSLGGLAKLTVWSHPGNDVTGMIARSEKVVNTVEKVGDSLGGLVKASIWSHPGNDVTGMIARSEKVVNTVEKLLNTDEVYHYHGKLINKDAYTGGTHLWHQDYGYWYNNGCLLPDMLTVFCAIDRCDKSNGCLKVLKGSHKCGRIDHSFVAGQTAGDIDRVRLLKEKLPLMFVELDPGDAMFFHCNVLHCSGPNNSPNRRWAYLMAYNTKANNPVKEHHHPCYTPLHKVPDSAIKECTNFSNFEGKEFLIPGTSTTSRVTLENEK